MIMVSNNWADTIKSYLFADRKLDMIKSSMAISSHWLWAIALFVGPSIAYNWGFIGLLWFVIPNALSIMIAGFVAKYVRDKYPDGYSLTQFISDNFSKRVANAYRIMYVMMVFVAFTYVFIGINKFWTFAGLGNIINPLIFSGIIGLLTLTFTVTGGIRTSIYTGAFQTLSLLLFTLILGIFIFSNEFDITSVKGKNNLTDTFNIAFLTSFAITFTINVGLGALSHGAMFQKAFSMQKEKIIPTYSLSALFFGIIVFLYGSAALWTFSNEISVPAADASSLIGIQHIFGITGLLIFGVILIGQSCTIIDAFMNYIASMVSSDIYNMDEQSKFMSRLSMFAILVITWCIAWTGIDLWTIWVSTGVYRTILAIPLVSQMLTNKLKEKTIFYSIAVPTIPLIALIIYSKTIKNSTYEMITMILAAGIPILIICGQFILDKLNKKC